MKRWTILCVLASAIAIGCKTPAAAPEPKPAPPTGAIAERLKTQLNGLEKLRKDDYLPEVQYRSTRQKIIVEASKTRIDDPGRLHGELEHLRQLQSSRILSEDEFNQLKVSLLKNYLGEPSTSLPALPRY